MNWVKIAQPYFKDENSNNSDLEQNLFELFKIEYVLGELNQRIHANPRLGYSKRITTWTKNLQEYSLNLAKNEIMPEMIQHTENWLAFHSGSGFANEILEWEEQGTGLLNKGLVQLGGNFEYNVIPDIINFFLTQNIDFVNDYLTEQYSNNISDEIVEENSNENPATWNDQDKISEVADSIDDIYGNDYQSIYNMFSNYGGDIDSIVETVLKTNVFQAWRKHWGDRLIKAEQNVTNALAYLNSAYKANDLNKITAAINLALNAQHVSGGMFEHMDISERTLEELSGLNTEELDEFVNMITGNNWKHANWLQKLLKVA